MLLSLVCELPLRFCLRTQTERGGVMTGCVALRKDIYYVRLSYYDKDHIRNDKFVSTGLSGRGAKQKATAMIDSL